jgi:YggT family protein
MLDSLLELLYLLLLFLLLARMIISFTNLSYYHPVRRTIHNLTEPILAPVRRILPPMSGFDLSPMVVLLTAYLVKEVLQSVL